MSELRKQIVAIITKKLDDMPNYEEYMVNTTMKVLVIDELEQLFQQERVKAWEKGFNEARYVAKKAFEIINREMPDNARIEDVRRVLESNTKILDLELDELKQSLEEKEEK